MQEEVNACSLGTKLEAALAPDQESRGALRWETAAIPGSFLL